MIRKFRNVPLGTVIIGSLAGCSGPPPAEASLAEQYNARRDARPDTVVRAEQTPSAQFSNFFTVTAETVLPEGAFQPTRCAASPDGQVYFSNRRYRDVFRWSPGTSRVERVRVPVSHGIGQPAALAWYGGRLHLLDASRNRVVRMDPRTGTADYVPVNAGQSPFAMVALADDRYLLGGERWETEGRMSLLARYAADGRLESVFLPREVDLARETDHFYAPVLLAQDDGAGAWVAEPVSFRLMRIDSAGRVRHSFGTAPPGYLPPVPVPTSNLSVDQLEAWMASWTPHVFIHAGSGLVFSSFQVRRPARGYMTTAYSPDGRVVATGMYSEALLLCGQGDRLYAARTSGGRSTVRELRYRPVTRRLAGVSTADQGRAR
jgi:hypothetical protein